MYLELEQLGKVLKDLSGSLEGVYYTSFLVDVTTILSFTGEIQKKRTFSSANFLKSGNPNLLVLESSEFMCKIIY